MSSPERDSLKMTIGGVSRTLKPIIATAMEIEDATGVGIVDMARQLASGQCRLVHVAAVLRCGLASGGAVFSHDDVIAMVERDGVMASMLSASKIVACFFKTPKADAPKKPNAAASQ